MLLNWWFSRISKHWWLRINNNVNVLVLECSAHISGSELNKFSWTMIELSFNFSFDKSLSFFSFVDPFSLRVTNSKANVDNVSVILLFSSCNVNQLNWASEVSFFVKSVGEVSVENNFVFVIFLAEKSVGKGIGSLKKILFLILWNIHVKKGRSLGWTMFLSWDGLIQKFFSLVEKLSCLVKFL